MHQQSDQAVHHVPGDEQSLAELIQQLEHDLPHTNMVSNGPWA